MGGVIVAVLPGQFDHTWAHRLDDGRLVEWTVCPSAALSRFVKTSSCEPAPENKVPALAKLVTEQRPAKGIRGLDAEALLSRCGPAVVDSERAPRRVLVSGAHFDANLIACALQAAGPGRAVKCWLVSAPPGHRLVIESKEWRLDIMGLSPPTPFVEVLEPCLTEEH